MKKCWICKSDNATTAEHKFKKSDLVRRYGKGPYKADNLVGHHKNEALRTIQGAGSKSVQYKKSLCNTCNSSLTQPFDKAYETFFDWIFRNEEHVISRRVVDLAQVFQDDIESDASNLYKYFVKHFGCKLIDNEIPVPRHLSKILLKTGAFRTKLRLSFCVNETLFGYGDLRFNFLGHGPLHADGKSNKLTVYWHHQIGWLRVCFWYNMLPQPVHGAAWTSDLQTLYLGYVMPENAIEVEMPIVDAEGNTLEPLPSLGTDKGSNG